VISSAWRTFGFTAAVVAGLALGGPAFAQEKPRINPTDPQPTCTMCPGTYIPAAELESYTKKAVAEKLIDQQVRDVDTSAVLSCCHQ